MARTRSHDDLLALLAKLPANVSNLRYNPDGTYEVTLIPAGQVSAKPGPAKKEEKTPLRKLRDIDTIGAALPEFGIVEVKSDT